MRRRRNFKKRYATPLTKEQQQDIQRAIQYEEEAREEGRAYIKAELMSWIKEVLPIIEPWNIRDELEVLVKNFPSSKKIMGGHIGYTEDEVDEIREIVESTNDVDELEAKLEKVMRHNQFAEEIWELL